MNRQRNSRTIGFKAFEDTDADILEWWESMPAGERSIALRTLIRAGISVGEAKHNGNGHMPDMVQVAADTAWLKSAMLELPTYLEGLLNRIPAARSDAQPVPADVQPDDQPQLDQAALDRRRANMKRSAW